MALIASPAERGTLILVYDDNCGPCSEFKTAVEFLDARHRLRFRPLRIAAAMGYLASVDSRYRFRSFHLVGTGGRVWSGADALPKLMEFLPFGSYAAPVVSRVSIARRAMTFLYRVASRLHETGDCRARALTD